MEEWEDTYKVMPPFNVQVWIRLYSYYGPPVKATRTEDSRFGNYFNLHPTNVRVPEWAVLRWKSIS